MARCAAHLDNGVQRRVARDVCPQPVLPVSRHLVVVVLRQHPQQHAGGVPVAGDGGEERLPGRVEGQLALAHCLLVLLDGGADDVLGGLRRIRCDGPRAVGEGRQLLPHLLRAHGGRPGVLGLLVQTVPALVQVRLQAREVVREDGAGHGGGGVVQADDVVEPAVGDEDGLPRLDDLRDDGSLRHQRVLGNQLLPGQQEVHVAVHPKAVVHEVLLVGADEPPQLAALHVDVKEGGRILVQRRDGALWAQPVVRAGAD
mmetsp:Transcript_16819/g.42152  ORF Transcript_16819/g.42152 Transcript_16819/m.42152 type:complete len:257 (+) Transcript_16819:153-923(+)